MKAVPEQQQQPENEEEENTQEQKDAKDKKVDDLENKSIKNTSSYGKPLTTFGSLSRDRYYQVHGLKSEHPKLASSYQPKYEFVEK